MTPAEVGRLDELLMEALTVLEPDESVRAQIVALPLGSVLIDRSGSLLWFSVVSATNFDDVTSTARFGTVFLRLVDEFNGGLLLARLE